MSIKIPLEHLKDEDIENFEKHLMIEEESKKTRRQKQKCPWIITPKFMIVRRDSSNVFIPFYWGVHYFQKQFRTPRHQCDPIKISFLGTLRQEQKDILRESVELLNTNGSCLMAIYPGGGKCLGKNTKILLSDGQWKHVQDIRLGDCLVDDHYETTRVKSLCRGKEMMYNISDAQHSFVQFTCNESHIMTLWDLEKNEKVDLSLRSYLSFSPTEKKKYKSFYLDYDAEFFNLREKRNAVKKKCTCVMLEGPVFVIPIDCGDNDFDTWVREIMLCGFQIHPRTRNLSDIYFIDPHRLFSNPEKRVINFFDFHVEKQCIDEYYGFELDANRRFLLWNGIMTHNTITSLAISSKIGLRTMILVNKLILIDQWIDSIKKVFGDYARIQHIKSRTKIQEGCQFYIMNAINVSKRAFEDYVRLKIGFLIVDECHLIMTKIFSKALGYICPRYLLGLSATPFRPDGFDSLLNLYFGVRKVVRKLFKPHRVYFIETKIKIVAKKDDRGEMIWNSVIDQQTRHEERNQRIVALCKRFHDRNILILSKRILQIESLHHQLIEGNEYATYLKDNESSFDKDARILIATFQKVGTGFSHDKLDMLILATDAEEYFIQYLGRVFRRPDVEPIIIDIVDDNPILKRHFLTRRKIYQDCGGILSALEKIN